MAAMQEASESQRETAADEVLSFAIADRNCRGRTVRLGPVLGTILSAHDYAPPIKRLLGEALVLTALMGSLLKDAEDQLTLQAQTQDGIVSLLVCDYRAGELRGYVQHDPSRLAELAGEPSLEELFGGGYLAITFDIAASGQRYQGVVPLEGGSLSHSVQAYFARSEQIPTLIRTAVRVEGGQCTAGGLLVQHLPEGEEGRERLHVRQDYPEWEHVAALTGSLRDDELLGTDISPELLVWRLYHEEPEVRVAWVARIVRGCRCSISHFEDVLSRFPSADRKDMRDENGMILVDCAFCSRQFAIQD
jgi:molecular chaperone Hsp33